MDENASEVMKSMLIRNKKVTWYQKRSKFIGSAVAAEEQQKGSKSLRVHLNTDKKPPSSLTALQLTVCHNGTKVRLKQHMAHRKIFYNIQRNRKKSQWYCNATLSVPVLPVDKVFDL